MLDVREYNDRDGRSPYAVWFNRLNAHAAAKVATALARLAQGNFSNVKGVGMKKRQQQDIEAALARWRDYKRRQ